MDRCLAIRLLVAICLAGEAAPLAAQVMRLPATVVVTDEPVSYFPASAPPAMSVVGPAMPPADPSAPPAVVAAEEDPDLRGARQGVFQKITFDGTWLPRLGDNGFGVTDSESTLVLGLPFPTRKTPLVITPGFAAHFLDGPAGLDLPARVYDAYTEFHWMERIWPRLGLDLAVTPGVYSDFEHSHHGALRLTGYGAASWTFAPAAKLVLGVAYLNRTDVNYLPIAGVSWRPHSDVNYDLVFPKPKIAHRIYCCGAYTDEVQHWVYLAGELGGGTWAFGRLDGSDDVFSYSDYRAMLGVERKRLGGLSARLEAGYVFLRKIRFDSGQPDFRPSDTLMVRAGVSY